jgi:ribulose-phosphate 3-epimerase
MAEIFPSLLAADQQKLDHYIKELEPLCPGFHIDIMDNKFVHNTGISLEKTNHIAKITYRQLWVHLMVQEPESYLDKLQLPSDSIVSFHIESDKKSEKLIKQILEKKWLPSIAISPKTGPTEIFTFLNQIYQVLIMSVEPGFSGQPFLPAMLNKVDPLIGYRETANLHFKIAVDGGISMANLETIVQKGVDQVAIGSELFEHKAGAAKAYQLLSEKVE